MRRIYGAGHTIGTHSQSHPLRTMSQARAEREIDDGIEFITAALGDAKALAPFFRIPGLLRTPHIEAQAKARDLVVWSSDTLADDWRKIRRRSGASSRAVAFAETRKGACCCCTTSSPGMVLMLPTLLSELKRRGFKIVHVGP